MIHECMFIRMPDRMSGEQYLETVRSGADFPPGAEDCSGPGLTSPGRTTELWLDLEPGNYIVGCWFNSHLTKLPAKPLEVVAGNAAAQPPSHDATLRLVDFRMELDGQLKKGPQVLKVELVGPSMHEVDLFRLNDDKTLADFQQWQKDKRKAPAPSIAAGGVLDSHKPGRTVFMRTNLDPGRYVLWCGMPMVQNDTTAVGDVSHADVGMFKELTIDD
jgi:hypothetical protein